MSFDYITTETLVAGSIASVKLSEEAVGRILRELERQRRANPICSWCGGRRQVHSTPSWPYFFMSDKCPNCGGAL